MKKFIKQLTRFLAIPGIITAVLVITYLYYDPFQVVYKYKSFYVSGEPRYVTLNFDYVAVETFLNNYPKYKYNSFIVGNSRSRYYEIDTWRNYIQSDKGFHFDANLETLYGINKKIELLNEKGVRIDNVLIILDYSILAGVNNPEGHIFIKHPLLSGQSMRSFQLEFFKAYCSFNFLPVYLDFKVSGRVKEYMRTGMLLNDTPVEYNLKYNETKYSIFEDMIKEDPSKYYSTGRMTAFYPRDTIQKVSPQVIKKEQIALLNTIDSIFKKHSTNVKIVISPLYDQKKLNIKDVNILKGIFGDENVFDFSGINSITADYHNYYEESHYRPHVASEIMSRIYRQNKGGSKGYGQ